MVGSLWGNNPKKRRKTVGIQQMESVKRIHFVGIGGSGMGGIAEILLHQGYEVSGSDPAQNAMVERLVGLKAKISKDHAAENVQGADLVVISSAITKDNPEVAAARALNIPVLQRAQMLAELMRSKQSIAVAGTHGKTTTTSLVSSLLSEAGLDPTYVIGGLLKSSGSNAHLGKSPFFVAEADESDASFLHLHPQIAIVTNIDADHLSTYGGDFNRLCDTFLQFIHQLPEDGLAIMCVDDPVIERLIPKIQRPILTYGFNPRADLCILNFRGEGTKSHFRFSQLSNGKEMDITLNLLGKHNALNAAAAYLAASRMGVSEAAIQTAFNNFQGVGRRMQIWGDLKIADGSVLLIDDYGHHPREMSATWNGIREAWPERRLVVVFQPHRYSRTQELFDDFIKVLSEVDQLLLLPIYPASEQPIPGIDSPSLLNAVRGHVKATPVLVPRLDALDATLEMVLRDGDILLVQGAGSVGTVAAKLAAKKLS